MQPRDVHIDLSRLSDKQLERYISDLMSERVNKRTDVVFSVSEVMSLLSIAVAEKNSRASSRLAKTAISIALVCVFIAAAGIWI